MLKKKGRKVGRTERTVGFKVGRTKGMTGGRWEKEKEL